jgi:hypothetical protein
MEVNIDMASREEKKGVLKYLKNNKVAGAESIAAELLKNETVDLIWWMNYMK